MSTQMIATPYGEGRLEARRARSTIATVLLSHGAGNGIETHDLQALASALPAEGFTVLLFEQPWRVAGRRVASPPASLDAALTAAVDHLRLRTPLVVGGRSAGARSAARTARGLGAAGCLALAFPLHPPGRPERSRAQELEGAGVPTLVIQGERDPMGGPEEFPGELGSMDLVVVPGADHSLRVAKRGPVSQEEADAILVESTLEWLVREVAGARE
ncbi:hydrolase [Nocardioides sp. BP30]|uniref:alpha/beta hydrolase family protein n=1 Tax=Nocardioides sp. BP30 TaxID=3036374 RepID=UPI0024687BAF|nr:alpha/beta family hydrolase [Nocardioides sp. BP30]WGL51307.1 hydrolase [Nocardioides sp. BP30]